MRIHLSQLQLKAQETLLPNHVLSNSTPTNGSAATKNATKVTSPWDGSTVIRPRCGPYSRIRYCSKKCLSDDVLMHWGIDCGQHTLTQRAYPLTIHPRSVRIHPFIPSLTHHDRPERHRQLIRHSVDTAADYFIFSDWVD
jgi:hypothetical protein